MLENGTLGRRNYVATDILNPEAVNDSLLDKSPVFKSKWLNFRDAMENYYRCHGEPVAIGFSVRTALDGSHSGPMGIDVEGKIRNPFVVQDERKQKERTTSAGSSTLSLLGAEHVRSLKWKCPLLL